MATLLLVEDDPDIYEIILPYAQREQMSVTWVRTVDEAEAHLREHRPDAVLIDRGLPGRCGDELAAQLCASSVPFIMLTARTHEAERLSGFDLGADDYVVKPFSAAELMRRIAAVLRRRGVRRIVLSSEVELDRDARVARARGKPLPLMRTEYAIVECLALRPERAFTRSELIEVLGLDLETSQRALDSHVKNLRRKFREAGFERVIETAVGVGYVLGRRR